LCHRAAELTAQQRQRNKARDAASAACAAIALAASDAAAALAIDAEHCLDNFKAALALAATISQDAARAAFASRKRAWQYFYRCSGYMPPTEEEVGIFFGSCQAAFAQGAQRMGNASDTALQDRRGARRKENNKGQPAEQGQAEQSQSQQKAWHPQQGRRRKYSGEKVCLPRLGAEQVVLTPPKRKKEMTKRRLQLQKLQQQQQRRKQELLQKQKEQLKLQNKNILQVQQRQQQMQQGKYQELMQRNHLMRAQQHQRKKMLQHQRPLTVPAQIREQQARQRRQKLQDLQASFLPPTSNLAQLQGTHYGFDVLDIEPPAQPPEPHQITPSTIAESYSSVTLPSISPARRRPMPKKTKARSPSAQTPLPSRRASSGRGSGDLGRW
jgi:hypothetical protein